MSTIAMILSFVVAAVALLSGAMKFTGSQMAAETPAHLEIPPGQYKLAGVLELLAAVGLVLAALDVVPNVLGAIAAFGLALMMVFAIGLHRRAGDPFAPGGGSTEAWAPAAFVYLLAMVTGILIIL